MILEEVPLRVKLLQSFQFEFEVILRLMLFFLILPVTGRAESSYESPVGGAYARLANQAEVVSAENHTNGWTSVISGGATLGVSIPGYYLSHDLFAKGIYTVGKLLGVAAVGYGTYLILSEDDYTRFHRVIEGVPELPNHARNRLAEEFLRESLDRARTLRKIRAITHSVAAGLHLIDGFATTNENLKIANFFLVGINTVAALRFGWSPSDEEIFAGSVQNKQSLRVSFFVGPLVGMRISF